MRKAAALAGVVAWLAAAGATTQAFADDQPTHAIEDRRAHLPPPVRLTNDEINTLIGRLARCWDLPAELTKTPIIVSVRISLSRDGSLAVPPVITNRSENPLFHVAAESALRAVRKCAPFTFLTAASYDQWKEIIVDFDPRMLTR